MTKILNTLRVTGTGSNSQALGVTGGYLSSNTSVIGVNNTPTSLLSIVGGLTSSYFDISSNTSLLFRVYGTHSYFNTNLMVGSSSYLGYQLQVSGNNPIAIVSSTDSTYATGFGGTTSYYYNPFSSIGGLSWRNTQYGNTEFASITVVGDGQSGYNGSNTTSPFLLNTGNILFNVGVSSSNSSEIFRVTANGVRFASNKTLSLNISYNSEYYPFGSSIQPTLNIGGNTSKTDINIFENSSNSYTALLNSNIGIDAFNSINNNITINNNTPTNGWSLYSFAGSLPPGRFGAAPAAISIGGNRQYSMFVMPSISNGGSPIIPGVVNSTDAFSYTSYFPGIMLGASTYSLNSYVSAGYFYTYGSTSSVVNGSLNMVDFRATKLQIGGGSPTYFQFNITRYGLLIDFQSSNIIISSTYSGGTYSGTYSYVGAWGVYQSDFGTKNYYAGRSLHGSTTDDGSSLIQVSGTISTINLIVGSISQSTSTYSIVVRNSSNGRLESVNNIIIPSNIINGTGSQNYLSVFNNTSGLTNSTIYQGLNNTILIGYVNPSSLNSDTNTLRVKGDVYFENSGNNFYLNGTYLFDEASPNRNNLSLGRNANNGGTQGSGNIAIGYGSLNSNDGGINNVAIGPNSLFSNGFGSFTAGSGNIAIGANSLYSTTMSNNNIAIGNNSLTSSNVGNNNISIGSNIFTGPIVNSTIMGSSMSLGTVSNNVIISDGSGNRRITINASGSAIFDSVADYGGKLQITNAGTGIQIISATDASTYSVSGGGTFGWAPVRYSDISFINSYYGSKSVVANISAYTDGYGSTTTQNVNTLYNFNSASLVFSIGISQSNTGNLSGGPSYVIGEKMRITANSVIFKSLGGSIPTISISSTPGGYSPRGDIYIVPSSSVNPSILINTTQQNVLLGNADIIVDSIKKFSYASLNEYPSNNYSQLLPSGFGYLSIGAMGYLSTSDSYYGNNPEKSLYGYVAMNGLFNTSGDVVETLYSRNVSFYSTGRFYNTSLSTYTASSNSGVNVIVDFQATSWSYNQTNTNSQFYFGLTNQRFGLLIDYNNPTFSYGTVSKIISNRILDPWGVYQSVNSTKNYFAGHVLLGMTTSNGNNLQVNGTASISGNLSLTNSTITDINNSTGNGGYVLSATSGGVMWIPYVNGYSSGYSIISGSIGQISYYSGPTAISGTLSISSIVFQNGNSFGATFSIGSIDNSPLQFIVNNSPKVIIGQSGDFNIGTSSNSNYNLNVNGYVYLSNYSTYSLFNNVSTQFYQNINIPNGTTIGTLVSSLGVSSTQVYNGGMNTITSVSNVSGMSLGVGLQFASSSIVQIQQGSISNSRAIAGLNITNSITSNNVGTISHLADLYLGGINAGSSGVTHSITNYYHLLIDDASELGHVSFINRYAIYQNSINDSNYFAGPVLNNNTTQFNSYIIDKTGSTGYLLSATSGGVQWVPNLSSLNFVQNGNTFGSTATFGTNDNYPIQFVVNGTSSMIIATYGNIGIGMTPSTSFALSILDTNNGIYTKVPATYSTMVWELTPSGEKAYTYIRDNGESRPYFYSTSDYGFKLNNGLTNNYFIFTNNGILSIGNSGSISPTITRSEKLQVNGDAWINGSLGINNIIYQNSSLNTNILTGSRQLLSIDNTKGNSAFCNYVLSNSTNASRAGTLMVVWNSTNIGYTDTPTGDIGGSTLGISLSATMSGGAVSILSTVTSGTWSVKMGVNVI